MINALSALVLICVVYVMWGLIAENRQLKEQLAQRQTTPVEFGLRVGDPLPNTPLLGAEGQRTSLQELMKHGGVIAFLTTTCPYCRATLPTWSRLASRYQERGVAFVGVSFHGPTETQRYVAENRLTWPVWSIAPGADLTRLAVNAVPLTVRVGADGAVAEAWTGLLGQQASRRLVDALDAATSHDLLSGSSGSDPSCCNTPAVGTDAGR